VALHRKFSFVCMGLPANLFTVVGFEGVEGLSRPYEFVIELASVNRELEMDDVLEEQSVLSIHHDEQEQRINGVLARFEQQHAVNDYAFYKAVLVPRLWCLGLTRHNQIFLDKTVPEILATALTDSKVLSSRDFELRLTRSYPRREYVCQYAESHLDFVQRWMEREGIYYFFEQTPQGEKLVITDDRMAHVSLPGAAPLRYATASGLGWPDRDGVVADFVCDQSLAPAKVLLRDYNYRLPQVSLEGQAQVSDKGLGQVYVYGDNFKTGNEGKALASVRAEQIRCRQKVFNGRSAAPTLRPGYLFTLEGHYRSGFNADYLVEEIRHQGDQSRYLLTGLGASVKGREPRLFYRNSFRALPAQVQFRPQRTVEKPRFHGAMHAFVEAEGDASHAYLDDKGRYKVRLPFDVAGRPKGRNSCWIRMAQPYGGEGHGMHFPLLQGTEVLLTFIDGDVDRPVIAGAVPNYQNLSVVKDANAQANAIRSASGNQLVLGDKQGQEFIGLYSPHADSGIAVGSHKPGGGGSVAISTKGVLDEFALGGKISAVVGAQMEFIGGVDTETTVCMKTEATAAVWTETALTSKMEYTKGQQIEMGDDAIDLKNEITSVGLDTMQLGAGVAHNLDELVQSAKKALAVGIAGSVVSSVGIATMSRPFDKEFLEKSAIEWKEAPSLAAGGLTAVAGAVMAAYCSKTIKRVADAFENAARGQKTSTINMGRDGIDISVACSVSNNATLALGVTNAAAPVPAAQKSTMTFASAAQSIKLNNKDGAFLELEDGDKFTARVKDGQNDVSMKILNANIYLEKPDNGKITVDGQGVKVESLAAGTPGSFSAKSDEARAACGAANSLSVKNDGVTLSASTGSITATGTLTLGGSTINIG